MSAWFRGIRAQLMVMVMIPFVAILVLGWVGYYSVSRLNVDVHELGQEHLPQAIYYGNIAEGTQAIVRSFWAVYGSERDVAGRKVFRERMQKYLGRIEEAIDKMQRIPLDPEEETTWNQVIADWKKARETVMEADRLFLVNTSEGDEAAKRYLFNVLRPAISPVEKGIETLKEYAISDSYKKAESARVFGQRLSTGLLVAIPAILFLIAAIGLMLAVRLSRSLGGIVSHISKSASEVGMASRQLSEASYKLSSGASEAASSLEETVASLEELSSMVKQNADNSKEAGNLSQSARESAEEGEGEVRQLIRAMGEISTSSKKIEEIINVIDDIAFQTNLLALNAAVEAARAGDQGRGFAVVAEAVRTLSQRSSSAAKDISQLIKDSVSKVDRGAQIADRSGVVLKKIVVNSRKVADLTGEIAAGSQEQAAGLSQISKAMNQLDVATQGNAASAEETAATSQQLSSEAESLHQQVAELVQVVDGAVDGTTGSVSLVSAPTSAGRGSSQQKTATSTPNASAQPASGSRAIEAIPFDDDEGIDTISGF